MKETFMQLKQIEGINSRDCSFVNEFILKYNSCFYYDRIIETMKISFGGNSYAEIRDHTKTLA